MARPISGSYQQACIKQRKTLYFFSEISGIIVLLECYTLEFEIKYDKSLLLLIHSSLYQLLGSMQHQQLEVEQSIVSAFADEHTQLI